MNQSLENVFANVQRLITMLTQHCAGIILKFVETIISFFSEKATSQACLSVTMF